MGLGNLGQAYLWVLGLLPYAADQCHLVLQDVDVISRANKSTSLLSREIDVGRRKTRVAAAWAEQRGFQTSIIERRFAPDFTVAGNEPSVALIGVDNPTTRRAIERVGFARIIEAGLGRGPSDYLGISLHTFPASRAAEACWQERTNRPVDPARATARKQAYQHLHAASGDGCGGCAWLGAASPRRSRARWRGRWRWANCCGCATVAPEWSLPRCIWRTRTKAQSFLVPHGRR